MGDFLTGFLTGLLTGGMIFLVFTQLTKQKRFTIKGWVPKAKSPIKYWVSTSFYSLLSIFLILYMIYT